MPSYLLVANETAESREMLDAVAEINTRDPDAEFVIVIPATPLNLLQQFEGTAKSARQLAAQRAQSTRRQLESLGMRVRSKQASPPPGEDRGHSAGPRVSPAGPSRRASSVTVWVCAREQAGHS